MESIIRKAVRTFALLVALCVTSGAWADTLRVLGDDITICSAATSAGAARISGTSGKLVFHTPEGCSVDEDLVFTKLQMISEGDQAGWSAGYARTITITVGSVQYTSGMVVLSSNSSIGNISAAKNVLTYNFPNVIVQAGHEYDITFNNCGGANYSIVRYGVENTSSGYVISELVSNGYRPYGVITVAKIVDTAPIVGSKILFGNTGGSGALSEAGAGECNFDVTIPSMEGLPAGTVVRVKNVSLASWNDNFNGFDSTNKKSDPYFININNTMSKGLNGETAALSSDPDDFSLQNSKIRANGSTVCNRLFFEYSNDCDLTVGRTYAAPAKDANNKASGLALLYRNGNLIFGSTPKDCGSVRYVYSDTPGIFSTGTGGMDGRGCYPLYELYAEIVSIPSTTKYAATISSTPEGGWSGITWDDSATLPGDTSSVVATLNVTENATINFGSAVELCSIMFNVSSGKVLTLTGNTLTASDITVTGGGMVKTSVAAQLSGRIKGDGTLVYSGNLPTGLTLNDPEWEGVLWLENKTGVAAWEPTKYGSKNSTIRMSGIQLYFNVLDNRSDEVAWAGTLDVTNTLSDGTTASYAIEINNGWSDCTTTFGKLTGSGTIKDISGNTGAALATPLLVFKDISGFTGEINLLGGKRIRIGAGNDNPASGQIAVCEDATISVAEGKTWSSVGGILVNGVVNGASGCTIPKIASGSTGTVASTSGIMTISGVINSTIETGMFAYPGATLKIVDESITSLTFGYSNTTYVNMGTLDLSACTSLETLNINMASGFKTCALGTIKTASEIDICILPTDTSIRDITGYSMTVTDATGNTPSKSVKLAETRVEYGSGSFSVANVPSGFAVVVTRGNGETATAIVTDGTARFADYGTVKISGAATMYDVSFLNTKEFVYKRTASANIGLDTAQDPKYNNSLNDATTGIYLRHHPYVDGAKTDIHGLTDFTLVVVGQMSPTHKTQFIHIGSTTGSNKGLLIATTDTDDEVIIVPNSGKVVDESNYVKVTVPNAASARHAYVINKTGSVFTVWVDGIKRGNFTVAAGWEIGSSDHAGVQVGSDFGGEIQRDTSDPDRYKSVADSLEETGVVNVIRIFDYVITDAQAQAIVAAYPYVSEGGLYTRTISADADLSATDAWAKNGSDTPYALPEGATVEEVFYNPSATVTVGADATLTVNANLTVDTLTVESTGGHTLSMASDGTHSIGVSGAAVVNSPLSITYGALSLAGTPVQLGTGGSLSFDCSGIDISEVYTTTRYQLTGLMDQDDTKVTVVVPTAPARTATKNYNANGYYELVVTPDHEAGSEVYFGSGYLDGTMTGSGGTGTVYLETDHTHQTALFPGDTMVIDNNSSLYQDQVWVSDAFIGNIKITRTTPMTLHNGELTNPILVGKTIAVESGASLTISKHTSNALALGALTINGTGAVALSGPLTLGGAVAGTATVTVNGTVAVMGGSIANTISGSGVLGFSALPTSPLSFGSWTGTVSLPAVASGATGLDLNNYGISGSTVSIAGISSGAWLSDANVAPAVEITGDVTLSAFSATFANTFNKLSGSGAFSLMADGTTEGYQDGYFLIKDVSDFTGSITVAAPGLALGGTSKPSSTEWYGKIVVQAPVTVGSGATWTAGGVVLANTSATLTVPAGATVPSSVVSGVSGYGVKTSTDGSGNTVYSLTKLGTIFSVY